MSVYNFVLQDLLYNWLNFKLRQNSRWSRLLDKVLNFHLKIQNVEYWLNISIKWRKVTHGLNIFIADESAVKFRACNPELPVQIVSGFFIRVRHLSQNPFVIVNHFGSRKFNSVRWDFSQNCQLTEQIVRHINWFVIRVQWRGYRDGTMVQPVFNAVYRFAWKNGKNYVKLGSEKSVLPIVPIFSPFLGMKWAKLVTLQ